MTPKISICVPSRNTYPYLAERQDSIVRQTFSDYEVVIVDDGSTDGSWKFFENWASLDDRVRLLDGPRMGLYPGWNHAIQASVGEYIYIATSDDTMAVDCLEKMVERLDANPDCDLAHCPLRVISVDGSQGPDWWKENSMFMRSSGRWGSVAHKRVHPFDGLLCLLGDNVYSSVTQLLIRRSLFNRIGMYRAEWGPLGDFHWNLRAGLCASTVHVPDTWASWRMHDGQATASSGVGSIQHLVKIDAMIHEVLLNGRSYIEPQLWSELQGTLGCRITEMRKFLRDFDAVRGSIARKKFALSAAVTGSNPAWQYIFSLLPGQKRWPLYALDSLEKLSPRPALVPAV